MVRIFETIKKQRIFGLGTGIFLIITILIILGLLNYFNIIPLYRYAPVFDLLPRQRNDFLNVDKNSPISVTAKRADYSVKLNSPQILETLFKNMAVRERKAQEFGMSKPFGKVVIVLTDEKNLQHKYAYFDGSNTTQFGYQFNAAGDKLVIFIYLPDEELQSANVSQLFSRAVFYAISPRSDSKEIIPIPSSNEINYLFSIESLKGEKKTRAVPLSTGGIKPYTPKK